MAETILSPDKLLVVVINTNAKGYSNMLCHIGASKHWSFKSHTIESFSLDVSAAPGVAKLTNWQEATEEGLVPLSDVSIEGEAGKVMLPNIKLDIEITPRFFLADVVPSATSSELTV